MVNGRAGMASIYLTRSQTKKSFETETSQDKNIEESVKKLASSPAYTAMNSAYPAGP